jgi:hypothetical protein
MSQQIERNLGFLGTLDFFFPRTPRLHRGTSADLDFGLSSERWRRAGVILQSARNYCG